MDLVKVGAADKVEQLSRRGLSGLELRYVRNPPGAIPVKVDYDYFLIDASGNHWDEVLSARNIAAYVPREIRNPILQLVVIQPS
jgi:type VI secretion system protein ImpJ